MPISSLIPLTGEFSAWKRGRGKPVESIKKSSFKFDFESPPGQGLVMLYIEKVEASLNGKNISHFTSKEEVFRNILTLHSLLDYPPGDYPVNLREDIVKGFVKICSFIRYFLRRFNVFLFYYYHYLLEYNMAFVLLLSSGKKERYHTNLLNVSIHIC
ncbi:unnamed protein product [Trifolium pratense]|uniref:Uncharacterized protein n=1 Tax=Trifolium pratense TaxID=57577 RepID=A0ACB0JM59_TRIPR|nr:unnamed protein product [Trifolium pratense]